MDGPFAPAGSANELSDITEVLRELGEIPGSIPDKQTALKKFTSLCGRSLGSQACLLVFVDVANGRVLKTACSAHTPELEQLLSDNRIALTSDDGVSWDNIEILRTMRPIEIHKLTVAGERAIDPSPASASSLNSLLAYPLQSGGQFLGYFVHVSAAPGPRPSAEKTLVALFSQQAVLVLDALERTRFARLNELFQSMSETRDEQSLWELALSGALELAATDRGWISKLDLRTKTINIVAARGTPLRPPQLTVGQGITGLAMQREAPIRVDDVHATAWRSSYEECWVDSRSELAVPITVPNAEVRVGGEIVRASKPIGVLTVESPRVGAFSQLEQDCLCSLARHAADILERLEFDRKVTALADVQRNIVGKRDWDEVIEILLGAIGNTLGYDYVNISLVNHDTNTIQTEYVLGIPDASLAEFKAQSKHRLESQDIQSFVVRTGSIKVATSDDTMVDRRINARFGLDQLTRVYIPLIAPSGPRLLGTVSAGHNNSYAKHIYERDIHILKRLVDYAAEALEQRQRGRQPQFWQNRIKPSDGTLVKSPPSTAALRST